MAIVHTKSIASWEGSGDMRLRIINSAKIIWLLGFCISCGGVILVDHDYRLTGFGLALLGLGVAASPIYLHKKGWID